MVKNPPAKQVTQINPWIWKIPWRREWLPTLVVLPGESHGQRSLTGYHGDAELDMTEQLSARAHTHIHNYAGSLSPWPLTSLSLRCTFCLGLLLSLFIHSLGSFLLCPPQNPHTRKVSIFITPCWQVPVITSLACQFPLPHFIP